MKRLLLIIFLLIFLPQAGGTQWLAQNSGVSVNLYDIEFFDENTGWAVGANGTVIKTTNGGANWLFMSNPTFGSGKSLNNLSVVDANTMYFVGGHYTLIKTTNGGINWIEIRNGPFGSGAGFVGIHMLNNDTGWVCGGETSLRTFNSFQNFDSSYIPEISLYDIHFRNVSDGLISSFGTVYKTTNSGLNWFETNVTIGFPNFYRICVADDQYAWVVGSGRVYRTTNFAASWTLTDTIPNISIFGIYFLNKDTGFAGGGGNQVFKTTDGGYNWIREKTDTNSVAFISSVWFASNLTGWYTGGVGRIYKTTTGGEVLTSISSNGFNSLNYNLSQNYPNPFNPKTNIKFDVIGFNNHIQLKIFNTLGEEIETLVDKKMSWGNYTIQFDAKDLPSGIYYYSIITDDYVETKKMVLVK